ncbi:MAG: hypothetical protein AAF902_19560 [Chloroflexota bacterium]
MAEQITISVSNRLYRRIAEFASKKERAVADPVNEVVEQAFVEPEAPVHPNRAQMQQEIETYERLHSELVQSYLEQYVAISDGQLIDADKNPQALLMRVKESHLGKVVLQRFV